MNTVLPRIPRVLASSVAALLALVSTLPAADLFWDGGVAGPAVAPADGGTGTWTDGVNNWLTTGGLPQAWSNLTPDRAILGGTAGTVTLGGPVTASGLRLDTGGYVLQGAGNVLTLSNNAVVSANYAATAVTNMAAALGGTNITINPLVANSSLGLVGQGTVRIGANTAHTGTLTVSNGILELANGANLKSSLAGLVINGAGNYHPSAATTHPFWQTRLGMLKVNGTGDAFGDQMVTLNGGTILRVSEAGGNDSALIKNVTLSTGDNMLISAPNGASGGDALQITNLFRSSTATVQFRSSYGTLGAAGDNGSILVDKLNGVTIANTNGIIGGWAFANAAPGGGQGNGHAEAFAAVSGLNNIVAAVPDKATNTAGGVLNSQALSSGTPTDNFLVNNNSTITADLTVNSLIAQNDVIVNAAATLTLGSGGLIYRGGSFWIQSNNNNGKITSGEAAGKLFLNVANTIDGAGDYRLRLQIVDGATPLQLIKSGNGSINLGTYNDGSSTNNSYTGGTIVQAGRIVTESASAFGAGSVTVLPGGQVSFGNGGSFTNAFTLSGLGAPENAGVLGALRFSGNAEVSGAVTLAGDTRIHSHAANDTGRITGPISGASNLEKSGAGEITVSNINSNFTGDVIVNAGKLVAQGFSGGTTTSLGLNSPTRMITINAGATLAFTENNIFGGGGRNASELPTIAVNGGTLSTTRFNIVGKLQLNGAIMTEATTDSGGYFGYQFLGQVDVGGTAPSTIQSTNGTDNHLLGDGSITFNVRDVTASSAPDLTVSNGLRDGSGDYPNAGSLVKAGAGTMVLGGANGYTGTTTVEAGTLLLDGTFTGSTFVSVLASATFGGIGTSNGNVSVLGGGQLQGGDGLLATGALTLGGTLTLADSSTISLALGFAGAHASLVRTGVGTWIFDSDQAFNFTNAGMQIGIYDNLISGLAVDPVVSGWTISTPGVVGTFSYDGAGGVDLTVAAVPEPATGVAMLGGLAVLAGARRRRHR